MARLKRRKKMKMNQMILKPITVAHQSLRKKRLTTMTKISSPSLALTTRSLKTRKSLHQVKKNIPANLILYWIKGPATTVFSHMRALKLRYKSKKNTSQWVSTKTKR